MCVCVCLMYVWFDAFIRFPCSGFAFGQSSQLGASMNAFGGGFGGGFGGQQQPQQGQQQQGQQQQGQQQHGQQHQGQQQANAFGQSSNDMGLFGSAQGGTKLSFGNIGGDASAQGGWGNSGSNFGKTYNFGPARK